MASAFGYRLGSRRMLATGFILLVPTVAFGFLMGFPLVPAAFSAVLKGGFVISLVSTVACFAISWMLKSVSAKKAAKELVLSRTRFQPRKGYMQKLKEKFHYGRRSDTAPPLVPYATLNSPLETTTARYSRV